MNSCHICQELRALQPPVEGVGRYSLGKVRRGGGLPKSRQGLCEGMHFLGSWTVLNKEKAKPTIKMELYL